MPTRADVNRSLAAVQSVTDLAVRDLWLFYSGLDLSRPEQVRDELLRFLPQLVATYGDVVSTAAAEWYEQVRHADLGGRYWAVLGPQVAAGQVQSTVRYAAKDLFLSVLIEEDVPGVDPAWERQPSGDWLLVININCRLSVHAPFRRLSPSARCKVVQRIGPAPGSSTPLAVASRQS